MSNNICPSMLNILCQRVRRLEKDITLLNNEIANIDMEIRRNEQACPPAICDADNDTFVFTQRNNVDDDTIIVYELSLYPFNILPIPLPLPLCAIFLSNFDLKKPFKIYPQYIYLLMIKHIYKYIDSITIQCYTLNYEESLEQDHLEIIYKLLDVNESYDKFQYQDYVEYGPRIEMVTPWCTNVLQIFMKCNFYKIRRIELSYLIHKDKFDEKMVDKMTQMIYKNPIETFYIDKDVALPYEVLDIKKENQSMFLGFDEQDLGFYEKYYKNLGRNPTNIELHDLAQSNSEHSRHWFFNGSFFRKNEILDESLMQMIKNTNFSIKNNNSVIAFSDNSSAIKGYPVDMFLSKNNKFITEYLNMNPVFTAETHNFPTSVAPFPGAATGTGGRIRDNQSIGRGGLCIT